jgi:hypothetical protein
MTTLALAIFLLLMLLPGLYVLSLIWRLTEFRKDQVPEDPKAPYMSLGNLLDSSNYTDEGQPILRRLKGMWILYLLSAFGGMLLIGRILISTWS